MLFALNIAFNILPWAGVPNKEEKNGNRGEKNKYMQESLSSSIARTLTQLARSVIIPILKARGYLLHV